MKLTEYKNAFGGIEMNNEHKQIMLDKILKSAVLPKEKIINEPSFKRQRTFGWKKSVVAGVLASVLLFFAIYIPLSFIGNGGGKDKYKNKEAILSIVREAQFTPDLKKLLPQSITGNNYDAQSGTTPPSKNRAALGAFASLADAQPDISGLKKIDVEEIENNQATTGYTLDEESHFDFLIETSKRDKELAIFSIENCDSMDEWYVLRNNTSSVKFSEYSVDKKDFLSYDDITGARTGWLGLILVKYSVSDIEVNENDANESEENESEENENEENENDANESEENEDKVIEILLHYIGKEPDISLKKRYVIYPDDVVETFSYHDHNPKYFLEMFKHVDVGYDSIPYLINKKDSEFFAIQDLVDLKTPATLYGEFTLSERKRVTVASYKKAGDNFEGLRMYNEYHISFDWDADTNQYIANGDISSGQRAEVSFLSGNDEEYFRISSQKSIRGDLYAQGIDVPPTYEYSLYKDKKWFNAATGVIFDKHDIVWIDGTPQNIYSDIQSLTLWFTHNNFDGIKSYYGDLNFGYSTKYIQLEDGRFYDQLTAPLFCSDNRDVYYDNNNFYRTGVSVPFGDWEDNGFGVGPYAAETHIGAYRPLNSTQSLEEFAVSLIWLPDGITLDFAVDLGILDKLPDIMEELSLLGVNDIMNKPFEILDKLNQKFILDKFISFDLDETSIRDSNKTAETDIETETA